MSIDKFLMLLQTFLKVHDNIDIYKNIKVYEPERDLLHDVKSLVVQDNTILIIPKREM